MPKMICPQCGKVYYGHGNRKYCSRKCSDDAKRHRTVSQGKVPPSTLCWKCKNTNAIVCPWFSKKEEPVPGWVATPTIIKSQYRGSETGVVEVRSYIVHECPLFEPDRR